MGVASPSVTGYESIQSMAIACYSYSLRYCTDHDVHGARFVVFGSKYGSYAEINQAGKISTPTLKIATVAAEVAS